MKNLKNKKGFTIVELVIVIAVIAILAAVLIPTFSGVIDRANKSAAEQAAMSLYKEELAKADDANDVDTDDLAAIVAKSYDYVAKGYLVVIKDGKIAYSEKSEAADTDGLVDHTNHVGTGTCTVCGTALA